MQRFWATTLNGFICSFYADLKQYELLWFLYFALIYYMVPSHHFKMLLNASYWQKVVFSRLLQLNHLRVEHLKKYFESVCMITVHCNHLCLNVQFFCYIFWEKKISFHNFVFHLIFWLSWLSLWIVYPHAAFWGVLAYINFFLIILLYTPKHEIPLRNKK